ncbi:similar to Saccharomyces cerevisiae YNR029C Putative protein of unknown function, deletion confers reduced fitness in saline [Maudiozyma saulgeensis]|uniref:CobW/HypB/UreG nucleotide-binding domain-containing protein n=1 Tax=Maudiozyma saulgeensis TaxID=1789683 RepID=A0A1X7R7H5_9SACH|nr:similar to Saccharomyces cerevisiae YNR029C Putative protein of unknown function, deletion confers reduced fitness in saline [Kazachstania saulgeensis]
MSALKNFQYNEEEDGELPSLVTGTENNLNEILSHVKSDGGVKLVSDSKIARVNKQNDLARDLSQNDAKGVPLKKIPVTIITGYLGSGKSTLLEKIALKGSDKKIAVIMNEFGDSSEIEKAMTIKNGSDSYQEWLDLGNGCLCCSMKNVGVKAIEDMVERSPGKIDYILLETSGIADPAPIAKMFWQDEGLNSSVYIDGIITVLDAEHILKCLDDISPETHWHGEDVMKDEHLTIAHFQIAMADKIILNKIDKLELNGESIKNINDIKERIQEINIVAPIIETRYSDVPLSEVLDVHSYDSLDTGVSNDVKTSKQLLNSKKLENRPTIHDPRMSSIVLTFRPLKDEKEFQYFIKNFLQVLLWKNFGVSNNFKHGNDDDKEWEIQRTKGLLIIGDLSSKREVKVIQGVRDTFDVMQGELPPNVDCCKLVLIGKYLNFEDIDSLLKTVIV